MKNVWKGGFISLTVVLTVGIIALVGGSVTYYTLYKTDKATTLDNSSAEVLEKDQRDDSIVAGQDGVNAPTDTIAQEYRAKETASEKQLSETLRHKDRAATDKDTVSITNETTKEPVSSNSESLLRNLEDAIDKALDEAVYIPYEDFEDFRIRVDTLQGIVPNADIERVEDKLSNVLVQDSSNKAETTYVDSEDSEEFSECISDPAPVFTHHITDISDIVQITPPGTIFDDGTVKSHSYVWNEDDDAVPVYAPTDMTLTSGAYYEEGGIDQYILFFEVSCEVEIKFDHIQDPIAEIHAVFPDEPKSDTRTNSPSEAISFTAGSLIGYTPGNPDSHNWDFGVYNSTLYPNPVTDGYDNLYEIDKRADCAYAYFMPELRETYEALFIEDIGGSSDHIPYCDS